MDSPEHTPLNRITPVNKRGYTCPDCLCQPAQHYYLRTETVAVWLCPDCLREAMARRGYAEAAVLHGARVRVGELWESHR